VHPRALGGELHGDFGQLLGEADVIGGDRFA
jgi:hypothetical protein